MHKHIYCFLILQLIAASTYGQCNELVRFAGKQGDKVVVMTANTGRRSTEPIQYRRVQERGQTQYFVQLYAKGGSFLPQEGVSVSFIDGSRLQWISANVFSSFTGDGYASRCSIKLSEDDIEQFQDKPVASITLCTQKRLLNPQQAQRAKNIINCIIGADLIEIKSDKLASQQ